MLLYSALSRTMRRQSMPSGGIFISSNQHRKVSSTRKLFKCVTVRTCTTEYITISPRSSKIIILRSTSQKYFQTPVLLLIDLFRPKITSSVGLVLVVCSPLIRGFFSSLRVFLYVFRRPFFHSNNQPGFRRSSIIIQ